MKYILIWIVLSIVVGIPTMACLRAASEADRQANEHFEKMVKKQPTEDKL